MADRFEAAPAATVSTRLPDPQTLLRQTDWSMLDHAYGSAEDVSLALTQLTDDDPDVRATALRYLERVNHQNTIYSATGPAAVYIAGILGDPRTVPAINANLSTRPTTYRSLRAMLLDWLGAVADDASAENERIAAQHGFALTELPEVIAFRTARPAIVNAVCRYLNDHDVDVRGSAIIAAAQLLDAPELASHADEADVKRYLHTHRHTDLKDAFNARVRARGHVPDNERKPRDDLTKALNRIEELVAQNNKIQGEHDALARIVNVLELENHELRTSVGRTGQLVALPSANDR